MMVYIRSFGSLPALKAFKLCIRLYHTYLIIISSFKPAEQQDSCQAPIIIITYVTCKSADSCRSSALLVLVPAIPTVGTGSWLTYLGT